MKKIFSLAIPLILFFLHFLCAQTPPAVSFPSGFNLIPLPLSLKSEGGAPFILPDAIAIEVEDPQCLKIAALAAERILKITGKKVSVIEKINGNPPASIFLKIDPKAPIPPGGKAWAQAEGYLLSVSSSRVEITAREPHGVFNGMQTLYQLLEKKGPHWQISHCRIEDRPEFQWRGMLLDVGRHFYTPEEVCRFLDLMSLYKYNVFHWHLTEDQGWRVEVKRYPKLTSVGAYRSASPLMKNMKDKKDLDNIPYGGFYTQKEIKTIVAHAASLFITVVPEFDIPGHSTAAVAAYPELGNDDIPGWVTPKVETSWGVKPYTLSPKESTFEFIQNVMDEILPLFPDNYVHIGGDEAVKDQWKESPFAQHLIKTNNLKNEQELQSWFIQRVEKILNTRGKKLIGWDEILEGGLSSTATVMVWHVMPRPQTALDLGNSIINSNSAFTYFDLGMLIEKVYSFSPIPDTATSEQAQRVLGGQAQLWTEFIGSQGKLEFHAWPRSCALSESLWLPKEKKNWENFSERLKAHYIFLDRFQVNYKKEDGTPAIPGASLERTPRPPVTQNQNP